MNLPEACLSLRIFIGESDRYQGRPLYEALVLQARETLGYGATSHLHTAKILRLSQDLPMVIEIVDTKEKIDAFLPLLDTMMAGGLVTLEPVQVLRYRQDEKK
jgi:hypothetical protein